MERPLYVRDLAEKKVWTEPAIRNRVQRGLLPFRKLGQRIIFFESEVDSYLDRLPGMTAAQAHSSARRRDSRIWTESTVARFPKKNSVKWALNRNKNPIPASLAALESGFRCSK